MEEHFFTPGEVGYTARKVSEVLKQTIQKNRFSSLKDIIEALPITNENNPLAAQYAMRQKATLAAELYMGAVIDVVAAVREQFSAKSKDSGTAATETDNSHVKLSLLTTSSVYAEAAHQLDAILAIISLPITQPTTPHESISK